jgi:hypothetical protein
LKAFQSLIEGLADAKSKISGTDREADREEAKQRMLVASLGNVLASMDLLKVARRMDISAQIRIVVLAMSWQVWIY